MQLAALNAVVKLFLVKGEEAQELVQKVLALATKSADNPDLRDRAYIQWRLLSSDLEAAKVRPAPAHCAENRGEDGGNAITDMMLCSRLF